MPPRGDLPQSLIDAGLALLDEEGYEALTLRRIAARAGVSHAAPAHHFSGLPGLRIAIATKGFRSFLHELTAARDALLPHADPFQRLLAVNLAYICFARRRRALFLLMFTGMQAALIYHARTVAIAAAQEGARAAAAQYATAEAGDLAAEQFIASAGGEDALRRPETGGGGERSWTDF